MMKLSFATPRAKHLASAPPRLRFPGLLLFALVTLLTTVGWAASPPNVVIILADDMGYSDIGCYGSEIATPSLDSLAKNGVRFTQFYNGARCCPTRAALLTGLYAHQAGIGLMEGDSGFEGYRGDLSRKAVTVAEVLRPAGYRTYMSGKWHVTSGKGPKSNNSNWPVQRGFDRFYGTISGAGSFYDPATLCRDNQFITPLNDPEYKPKQFYYTDAISDNAVKFMEDHAKDHAQKPLFLYVAATTPATTPSVRRGSNGHGNSACSIPAGKCLPPWASGTPSRTANGKSNAWRSMPRWSSPWIEASGASPRS
jgi:arylsulfatase